MNESRDWERDTLRDIAFEGIKERRRARRWGIFFKFLFFGYLVALLAISPLAERLLGSETAVGPHTAIIDIAGQLSPDAPASADRIIEALQSAYASNDVRGVMLRIDSPGGSPVEAGRVVDEMNRLRGEKPDLPVYAVAGNLCTSGAYYIAAAADEIYADKASVVGSIGVIMGGFGFAEAISRLGVERRLYTAGEDKAFMDPFSPVETEQVAHVETLLEEIHEQFIGVVRSGRGDRLAASESELFSGRFWTGERSVALGLVDGLGGPEFVARELIGESRTRDYMPGRSLLERLSDRVGASVGRALWSFGFAPAPGG